MERRIKLSMAAKKQLYRLVVGYNNIPVHKQYYSITFTAFAKKKEDLPSEDEAEDKIESQMEETFGKHWRDWIPDYWDKTGVSIERRKFPDKKDGDESTEIEPMGVKNKQNDLY